MAAAGLGALLLLLLLLAAPCAGQRHGEPGGWEGARERKGEGGMEEGPQHPTRAERARPGVPHRCGALWVSVRVTM